MSQSPARKSRRTTVKKSVETEAAKIKRARDRELIAKKGVTSAAEWRKGRQPVHVVLPSGHVCKAVNKGMDAFLKAGKIPNALMPIIRAALAEGEGRRAKPKDIGKDALDNPEVLSAAVELADTITCECVTEPVIRPVPMRMKSELENEENPEAPENWEPVPLAERDFDDDQYPNGFLWVDEADLNDKIFIMNWVMGGTQDVERFREELADVVDDIQSGEGDVEEA